MVTQATDYFQYEWCLQQQQENRDNAGYQDDKSSPNGRTFVMDGLEFLSSMPSDIPGIPVNEQDHPYDLVIVDVYTGWNPFAFFVREKMLQVRDNWLTADGVLVMNFVGYMHGPPAAVPKSIYRTLQSVFKYVKCFREMEELDELDALNLVFYASDKPIGFSLPTTEMYQDPPDHTYFSVRSSCLRCAEMYYCIRGAEM